MKQKIPYADAVYRASRLLTALDPACQRIMIAGSIRRKKAEIGDIELVLIPFLTPIRDMFDEPTGTYESALDQRLVDLKLIPFKGGEKYKQIVWEGMQADLFICTPETWAVNTMIRTGSADFTRWMVTQRRQGGALRSGLAVRDAQLWDGARSLELVEEADVFAALGLRWIPPEERVEGRWVR